MSQIFDALRQSESDRSGTVASAARELLEVVERSTERSVPASEQKQERLNLDRPLHYEPVRVLLDPQSKLVCVTDQESLAAEKFRFLSIRLRHLQQKRALKRILVTSSVAGEGKSTVAGNLSCALAGSKQQRVLLLEGDLRRPSLTPQLGLGELPGLSELLEGESNQLTNVYHLETLGFWIMPAGRPPSGPLEILQPGRLSMIMDRLGAEFDWIVIDSPPVLPLADTSVWMRLADAVLLVTRPGTTAKKQLLRSLETIEQGKLLGAILNGSKEAVGNYHYYYSARSAAPQSATQPAK